MQIKNMEYYSTESLKRKKSLSDIALYTVWIGGGIGMLAALSNIWTVGTPDATTFVVSVFAIIASYPVLRERKQIIEMLRKRGE